MVITLSGTFVVLRHAAQTRHYDSRNKSVDISQVTNGFFFILFFSFFHAVFPSFSPASLLLPPPPLPHRIFLPVSPVTSRPSLQQQHRGQSPLGKKKTHISQATHSSADLMCAVHDTVLFRSECQGIIFFFTCRLMLPLAL